MRLTVCLANLEGGQEVGDGAAVARGGGGHGAAFEVQGLEGVFERRKGKERGERREVRVAAGVEVAQAVAPLQVSERSQPVARQLRTTRTRTRAHKTCERSQTGSLLVFCARTGREKRNQERHEQSCTGQRAAASPPGTESPPCDEAAQAQAPQGGSTKP